MRSRVGIVLSLSLLWASLRASALTLVNITVDDNDPSVIYAPSDDWSFGPSCSTCTARVDASQAFNGTWHDTLFSPSDPSEDETQTAELSFIGSAIYVYGILSNAMNNPSGNADQVFFVDGVRAGNFTHTPSGDGSFEYSVLLFSAQLPNGSHNLTLQNGQPTDVSSLILLDYFVYTTAGIVTAPSSSSNSISTSASTSVASTGQVVSSTPSSPPAASSSASGNASGSSASRRRTIIIVVVVICIAVVALLALFVLLRHRRFSRRNMTDPSAFPPEAFSINPTIRDGCLCAAQRCSPVPQHTDRGVSSGKLCCPADGRERVLSRATSGYAHGRASSIISVAHRHRVSACAWTCASRHNALRTRGWGVLACHVLTLLVGRGAARLVSCVRAHGRADGRRVRGRAAAVRSGYSWRGGCVAE
ncbi:uncharacterized protein PHACADRAFT_262682 [Phanerochaete carnosa HHB-10118-sp]|uniref:Uncharacterized protein n=1 Tax=Phanerochaete carnosa (strain HHB-10118-sp) TaxID=650164 RepID=K5VZX0_PHACS|nr:uncharacterized protein PHACADRAFT_262682 [Phanerochaete carnosa HHB-10118-sp]EKM52174.1 hypothetical protein PHACADRAFT_262682 [Phanerochaete carnosa HHB-10118-sp]